MVLVARVACLRQTLLDCSNPRRLFRWAPRCWLHACDELLHPVAEICCQDLDASTLRVYLSQFVCSVLVQDVLLRQGLVCCTVADDRARREDSRLQEETTRLQETVSKLREDNLVLLAMNSLLERSIAQFNAVSDTIRRQITEARQTPEQKQQPQAGQAPAWAAWAAATASSSSGGGQAQSPALSRRVPQTLLQASPASGPCVVALAGAQRKRKRSASAEPASKRLRPSLD
jgi:hypothetical protein